MSEAVAIDIASQRCQQARRPERAEWPPDFARSEGFFEDLSSDPPPMLRLRRSDGTAPPAWAGVLASALGLRRG